MRNQDHKKIVFVCYHYLRRQDEFARIWGIEFAQFQRHIEFLKQHYPPISINDLGRHLSGQAVDLPDKCSILTFDDGLKEQATIIAPYLARQGIKAVFNIPTCIFRGQPLNPQVIHFGMAYYGIRGFNELLKKHFSVSGLAWQEFDLFTGYKKDIYQLHENIKKFLKYTLTHQQQQRLLLKVWQAELLRDVPEVLDKVYMSQSDVEHIVNLGHEIGLHTDSHALINDQVMTDGLFAAEIKNSKQLLETICRQPISCFAYPYADKPRDVLRHSDYLKKFNDLGLKFLLVALILKYPTQAFIPRLKNKLKTTMERLRPRVLDLNFIDRYSSMKDDTPDILKKNLILYELSI